jgi:hypothetical protein
LVITVKWITLAVAIAVVLALVVAPGVARAHDPVVSLTVVAPDRTALANATVKLIDATGKEYSSTTDATGKASVTVPAGLYYVLVHGRGYYILSVLNVTRDMSVTIDASTMPALIVRSTEASVEFSIARSEISTLALKLSTNATIYTDPGKTVTLEFPREVVRFPYKYTLQKVVYGATETTNNTVTLTPVANITVTARYSKTLYFALPAWGILALGVTVVVAIGVVWFATRAAKHVVVSIRDDVATFVRRKRFATRKVGEW